jgi:hypothetical protein
MQLIKTVTHLYFVRVSHKYHAEFFLNVKNKSLATVFRREVSA